MFSITFFYMPGIPVAYEIKIDEIRDANLIEVEIVNESDHIGREISNNVLSAYNLSRIIKFCTWTSGFLSLIYCTYNFYFLIPLLITICGWFGADKYSFFLSSIYFLYLISTTIAKTYLFFSEYFSIDISFRGDYTFELILVCLSGLINICLTCQVVNFMIVLGELDDITISRLKKGQIGNLKRIGVV